MKKLLEQLKKLTGTVATAGIMNSLALALIIQSVNTTCSWFYHQPEVPESANAFKRH